MSKEHKQSAEAAVREIRRLTRRKFSPEEKIRIVLEGLRGEQSIIGLFGLEGESPRIPRRSPSHTPVPQSSRIWRDFARRMKSSSACITAAE